MRPSSVGRTAVSTVSAYLQAVRDVGVDAADAVGRELARQAERPGCGGLLLRQPRCCVATG